jgi:hypothetical protein
MYVDGYHKSKNNNDNNTNNKGNVNLGVGKDDQWCNLWKLRTTRNKKK